MVADMSDFEKVVLSEEDRHHFKAWQRLSTDEKEALNKLAKLFSEADKRKSLYTLIEAQTKISSLLATAAHIGWLGRMFLKAGVVSTVVLSVAGVYTLWKK